MESEAEPCEDLFSCTLCGECCKGFGGTYLSDADIEAIARFLDIDTQIFIDKYTALSGSKRLIRQAESGYCVFWDRVCTIHPVKPRMCRQWPFIRNILVDVGNWRAMAKSCPGMNADAADDDILACVKKAFANREDG